MIIIGQIYVNLHTYTKRKMSLEQIRSQFPALQQEVFGRPLVYLDNAASAQRPQSVIDCWNREVLQRNANIHRAVHQLSVLATEDFEKTRDQVKAFLHAEHREEIVFTSGATQAANLVAFSFGEAFVGEGDEIIVSVDGHHSNIVPWQMLCERKKAVLKVLDIAESGVVEPDALQILISQRTKLVAISHISNVLGLINPLQELISISHQMGVPVLVDGAQGIVHESVDVQEMDCDFYLFSGHKLYAATGTGVLYGKKKWLDAMPPFMGGGEMIRSVSMSGSSYADTPHKFEAGTQNFNAVPTLVPAIDFVRQSRQDAAVQQEQQAILDYVSDALTQDPRITLYGKQKDIKVPLFSFSVQGAHHEDLALIMDKMGIALRSGQMCAEPLMDRFGVTGMLRASLAPYNTIEEAEYFIKSLERAVGMLI